MATVSESLVQIGFTFKQIVSDGCRRVNLFGRMPIDSRAGLKWARLPDFGRTDGASFLVH
jgi:hypothetical protein